MRVFSQVMDMKNSIIFTSLNVFVSKSISSRIELQMNSYDVKVEVIKMFLLLLL